MIIREKKKPGSVILANFCMLDIRHKLSLCNIPIYIKKIKFDIFYNIICKLIEIIYSKFKIISSVHDWNHQMNLKKGNDIFQ